MLEQPSGVIRQYDYLYRFGKSSPVSSNPVKFHLPLLSIVPLLDCLGLSRIQWSHHAPPPPPTLMDGSGILFTHPHPHPRPHTHSMPDYVAAMCDLCELWVSTIYGSHIWCRHKWDWKIITTTIDNNAVCDLSQYQILSANTGLTSQKKHSWFKFWCRFEFQPEMKKKISRCSSDMQQKM